MSRVIAIGDIHGYSAALEALVAAIDPSPDDIVVPLGDYIDRGPDVPGTFDRLLALAQRCRLAPILGNHDEMLLRTRAGEPGLANWLAYGGAETLAAYGIASPADVPDEHVAFLQQCLPYWETETHLFVHACYLPHLPLAQQPATVLRWQSLWYGIPDPHFSGKIAIVGHTAQKEGEILDLGHLYCIDTFCYGGKRLTALDVGSGQVWQADPQGRLRSTERP